MRAVSRAPNGANAEDEPWLTAAPSAPPLPRSIMRALHHLERRLPTEDPWEEAEPRRAFRFRGVAATLGVGGILGAMLLAVAVLHRGDAGSAAAQRLGKLAMEVETTVEGHWEGLRGWNKEKAEMRAHKLAVETDVDEDGSKRGAANTTNPFAAVASKLRLKAEEKLWQVVSETAVNVRANNSLESHVIGDKPKCTLAAGWRMGDWVKLADGGFMEISSGGQARVRNLTASYSKISNGTCRDAGRFPITDPSMCRVAAASLGLRDTIVKESPKAPLPEGCYLFQGRLLWLATNPDNAGRGALGDREPLCSTHAPCHPVTSTATTTTSTTTATKTTSTLTSTRTSTTTSSSSSSSTSSSITSVTTTTTSWPSPSLFCFSVARVNGDEPGLLNAQFQKHASIFACDEYAVYSNGGTVWIGSIETANIPVPTVALGDLSQKGVTTDSWLNTMIFMEVWKMIAKDGRFRLHDWVVKVDPDAVFFPQRLKRVLRPASTPGANLYVANCGKFKKLGWSTFYGSLEVFSNKAVATYVARWETCKEKIDWKGWGEDLFMKSCMEMLGVGKIELFGMLADHRCDWAPCNDPSKVAYHDFKDVGSYIQCWDQSSQAEGSMAIQNVNANAR